MSKQTDTRRGLKKYMSAIVRDTVLVSQLENFTKMNSAK